MSYQVKYQIPYTSRQNDKYRVDILQKDYVGSNPGNEIGTYTANWKYFTASYFYFSSPTVLHTRDIYYAYVPTLHPSAYYYASEQTGTPPASVNAEDADINYDTEVGLAFYIMRSTTPDTGAMWSFGTPVTFHDTGNTLDLVVNEEGSDTIVYLSSATLTGAASPFIQRYQSGDDKIINPIRASEADVSFFAEQDINITSFYSDDDEGFRIDHYFLDSFLTGNNLIEFEAGLIVLYDQAVDPGIVPGQNISIRNKEYLITAASYDAGSQSVSLTVTGILADEAEFFTAPWEVFNPTLLWRGYVVQDNCQEDFQDAPYVITLNATDNIALLKDVPYNDALTAAGTSMKELYESATASTATITGGNTIAITEPIIVAQVNLNENDLLLWDGIFYTIQSASFDSGSGVTTIVIKETFPADGVFTGVNYSYYVTTKLIDKTKLFDYIKIALLATGISLPFRIYANIFENTTDDRDDNDIREMFSQTRLFSGMFENEDGTWQDMYSILEAILKPLNATILQAEGFWNVIRFPEALLYIDNEIEGTAWDEDFENPEYVIFKPNFTITHGTNITPSDYEFINADAIRKIVRPFRFAKETFNYKQPKELIYDNNLRTDGLTFIATSLDGAIRFDDYAIPSQWKHINGDTSFIRVVTDTAPVPEVEIDRYVYQPKIADFTAYTEFNRIQVNALDSFDFSLSFKLSSSTGDNFKFGVGIVLFTADGNNFYFLTDFNDNDIPLSWDGPNVIGLYTYTQIIQKLYVADFTDSSTWIKFSLSELLVGGQRMPPFPEDGIIQIAVMGLNDNNPSQPDRDVQWKDINFDITYMINESTNVIGQAHTQTQENSVIKNNSDEDILIDDSPKFTTAGALFTNAFVGSLDEYLTLTTLWHRRNFVEELRLGQLVTFETKFLSFKSRSIIEGTFTGVRYSDDSGFRFLSLLNILQIDVLTGLNFIIGLLEIDYKKAISKATLWELYKEGDNGGESDEDNFVSDYLFKYLYKTN